VGTPSSQSVLNRGRAMGCAYFGGLGVVVVHLSLLPMRCVCSEPQNALRACGLLIWLQASYFLHVGCRIVVRIASAKPTHVLICSRQIFA